jgi:hypothetical protein
VGYFRSEYFTADPLDPSLWVRVDDPTTAEFSLTPQEGLKLLAPKESSTGYYCCKYRPDVNYLVISYSLLVVGTKPKISRQSSTPVKEAEGELLVERDLRSDAKVPEVFFCTAPSAVEHKIDTFWRSSLDDTVVSNQPSWTYQLSPKDNDQSFYCEFVYERDNDAEPLVEKSSNHVKFSVLYPPFYIDSTEPDFHTLQEYAVESVVFNCTVDGNPRPSFGPDALHWTFVQAPKASTSCDSDSDSDIELEEKPVVVDGQIYKEEHVEVDKYRSRTLLNISGANSGHAGCYICKYNNTDLKYFHLNRSLALIEEESSMLNQSPGFSQSSHWTLLALLVCAIISL